MKALGTAVLRAAMAAALLSSTPLVCAEGAYVRESAETVKLGNDLVELTIDRLTGYFIDILGKSAGIHHKLPGTGSWPFGFRLGNSYSPDLLRVEITEKALHPQRVRLSSAPSPQGQSVRLTYDDLTTTGGNPSGIALTVAIELDDTADYFKIRAQVRNQGKHSITNLFSGSGDLIADEDHQNESLAVPGTSFGTIWTNPHGAFAERETFGYPIFGSDVSLDAAWIDLYGSKGGIGTGYLNRQGLTMHFNVERSGKGLRINWQLFDLMHEKARNRWTSVGGIYPLRPGHNLDTGTWILAPHAGDWHRMADIYRVEYERNFKGDFLDWAQTHPRAKQIDLTFTEVVFNIRDMFPGEQTLKQFTEVPETVRKFIDATGIDAANLAVVVVGHSIHFCLYMPDFLPVCAEAGGEPGFRRMMSDLKGQGIQNILLYTHFFYNHPKANDYVRAADTGYDHQNVWWKEIGNVACLSSPEWMELWKSKYIPGYRDLGISGIIIDQGPAQYLVCADPSHPHGNDPVAMLRSHTQGVLDLIDYFNSGFANERPVFWTEAGSDLVARTMDIWSCAHRTQYAKGGVSRHEIGRYTFPYRLCVDDPPLSAQDVNDALINGFILGGWLAAGFDPSKPEINSAIRQFVRIRRELRKAKAPGYPYGFRDNLGLRISDSNLVARGYGDAKGITVVYYAQEPVENVRITVDKSVFGFSGEEEVFVNLQKDQAGYAVFPP